MKKFAVIMGFLGMLIMLVGLPPAFAGPVIAEVSSRGPWVPIQFDFFNDCTNEFVSASGMQLEECTAKQDSSGGNHMQCRLILHGTAVGMTTGAGYVFSETFHDVTNLPKSGVDEETFLDYARMMSLGRNMPDLRVRFGFHTTIDANGIPRAEFNVDEVICK